MIMNIWAIINIIRTLWCSAHLLAIKKDCDPSSNYKNKNKNNVFTFIPLEEKKYSLGWMASQSFLIFKTRLLVRVFCLFDMILLWFSSGVRDIYVF
jgi:hypothetical protein